MPRRANPNPAAARRDPGPDLPDHPVQRTVPAATAPPLSTIFQAGAVAKQAAKTERARPRFSPPDPDAVKIVSGKTIPPLERGPGAISPYQRLYDRLKKNQCAEGLTPSQARSFASWAKRRGKRVTIRVYPNDTADAWRMD